MSVKVDEGGRIIKSIFPGADQDRRALFDKNKTEGAEAYRIGKHFILLWPDVTSRIARIEWRAGGRWVWNVEAAKRLDAYRPRTEADLIGWVSYIWESITHLAQQTLISLVDPADLFPNGFEGHHNGAMIRGSLEVLQQCGKAPHEIIRYVADDMTVKWVFNRPVRLQSGQAGHLVRPFSMLFKVNSSTEGNVVGRISEKFMGETPFQWAYDFPIGTKRVARKGGIEFRGSDSDFIERAQKLLKRLYIKAIFDFLQVNDEPVKFVPRTVAP